MKGDKLIAYIFFAAALFVVILVLTSGCSSRPSCSDNPRNMRCMSADQLRKELSK